MPRCDPTSFQCAEYFPALDGIRAFSVLLVMIVHLKNKATPLLLIPGWAGVDVFFVLSGFLITTLLVRERASRGLVNFVAFFARRFFRIVPVYLVALLAYVVICYAFQQGSRWDQLRSGLPYYVSFLNEYSPSDAPFHYSWTLGIEEKFYLLWPCIAFAICRSLRARVAASVILIGSCAFLSFEFGRSYSALLLGSLVALLLASRFADAIEFAIRRVSVAVLAMAVLLSFLLLNRNAKFIFCFDVLVALLLVHLLFVPSRLRTLLSLPGITWFGKRSYSMYLFHLLVLNFFVAAFHAKTLAGQCCVLIAAYVGAGLVANLLYRTVERPSRNLGKRLLSTPVPRETAALSTS